MCGTSVGTPSVAAGLLGFVLTHRSVSAQDHWYRSDRKRKGAIKDSGQ